jgi:hypothetical protein
MKKLQLITPLFFLSMLIFSCSKTEVIPKTKTDLLIANVWKLTKVTQVSSGKTTVVFERGVTPTTLRDDLGKVRITFFKDGMYSSINADNGKESGTWKFTNNENQIEFINSAKSNSTTLFVDKLEEGKLNFTEKDGSDVAQYESIPE